MVRDHWYSCADGGILAVTPVGVGASDCLLEN